MDWHICACGALARLEQIRRADSQPKVRHRSEPLGSAIDRKPGDAEPWVTIGFFGNASGRDRRDATLRPELGDELASIVARFRLAEQEPAKLDRR